MYLPKQFQVVDHALALDIMRQNPFASLISTDEAGLPFVTHVPIHVKAPVPDLDPLQWVLLGHVAKGNPHWKYLQSRPTAVVTFMGPHAYLSPSVYPDLARVPTWNYLAVHCTVESTLIEDAAAIRPENAVRHRRFRAARNCPAMQGESEPASAGVPRRNATPVCQWQ